MYKVNKQVEGKLGSFDYRHKSSGTSEVAYACRYTSGHLIPT